MNTLNQYFSNSGFYHPLPDSNIITVSARIPALYEDKVKKILTVKGYNNSQDYFNALFNERKDLETVIIPYEILKLVDEDFYSINGLYETIHEGTGTSE
jgi:hypothetical protein